MMAGVRTTRRPAASPSVVESDVAADRRPGRPRSVEADAAILDATLDLLADVGYARLTMEGVATHAGVGKATLYRRWSSKVELILEAIRTMKASVPHPDTGDTRADLVAIVKAVVSRGSEPRSARISAALLAEVQRDPELAELFRQQFLVPRRLETEQVLQRGIARGDVRADIDPTLVLDQLMGSVFYRQLVLGQPLRVADVGPLVDQVLQGITTRP